MLGQIFTIARNTFTESIRQPIFLVVLLACCFLLVLNPFFATYTLDDDNKLLIDLGMSTILLGGLFLAAFTATGVLAREIENKTVLTVISKPIGRPAFVLGKFFGVAGALGVACYIWSLIFLLTLRHRVMFTAAHELDQPVLTFGIGAAVIALIVAVWGNYFYGWVFSSRFAGMLAGTLSAAYLLVLLIDKEWQFQGITTEFTAAGGSLMQVLIALTLVLQSLIMICSIAIACSTRLGQVMTLMVCLGIFLLGLSSDWMIGRFTDAYPLV
ncbi:MAG: hypothetical protein WD079_02200, partial [Phycisphaeraceae bacterium]